MAFSVPNKFSGTGTSDVSKLDDNFSTLVADLNSDVALLASLFGYGALQPGVAPPTAADLNSAPLGWAQYIATATNVPSPYSGLVLTISTDGSATPSASNTVWQIAYTYEGHAGPWRRASTPAATWGAWSRPANEAGDSARQFAAANGSSAAYVATYAQVPGLGQTWHTETGSRALNTVYTNSNAGPLTVSAICSTTSTSWSIVSGYVGSGVASQSIALANASQAFISFLVPPGQTYKIEGNSTNAVTAWFEMY